MFVTFWSLSCVTNFRLSSSLYHSITAQRSKQRAVSFTFWNLSTWLSSEIVDTIHYVQNNSSWIPLSIDFLKICYPIRIYCCWVEISVLLMLEFCLLKEIYCKCCCKCGVLSLWPTLKHKCSVRRLDWLTVEIRITYGFMWGPGVLLEWEIILSKECLLHHNFRLRFPCGDSDMGSRIQPRSDQCGATWRQLVSHLSQKQTAQDGMQTWVNFNLQMCNDII